MLTIISAAFTSLLCLVLGYFFGRYQKYKELLYAKKLENYSTFTSAIMDFVDLCSTTNRIDRFAQAKRAHIDLIITFHKTALWMPRTLYKDISGIIISPSDAFLTIHNIEDQEIRHIFELPTTPENVQRLLAKLGFSSLLPGPFEPLCDKAWDIVNMLRSDLGIERMSGRFYRSRKAWWRFWK